MNEIEDGSMMFEFLKGVYEREGYSGVRNRGAEVTIIQRPRYHAASQSTTVESMWEKKFIFTALDGDELLQRFFRE